ncbi:MAG TPA: hypothetical protein VKU19_12515 [Bryobacteraceae bacterium]|nr:hypothetical protein [Bryobacteraceae bacterium]
MIAGGIRRATLCAALWWAIGQAVVYAQTVDDGVMIPAKSIFAGYLFTHDSWDHYWEGTLNRANGNIGTLTTETSTLSADYGLTNRINLLGTVPYVGTQSSQGVLASQQGWQDVTLAVKILVFHHSFRRLGALAAFAVPFWGKPMTNYTPDLQPLSIGLDSMRAGGRATLNFQSYKGWFLNASGAYTWRDSVTLDRPYYFTNNQFFETDIVPMPRVVDYSISPGYSKKGRMVQFTFSKLITQGGVDSGDIRRQDLPFVSNRMIASRVGGSTMYPLPRAFGLALRLEYSYVIDGRNVGQSSTVTVGLFKTQSLRRRKI